MTETQPTLPGMAPGRPDRTATEVAAQSILDRLRNEGQLKAEHALIAQLVLDLARAVGISADKGRASGVALAARELREAIALLPKSSADALAALLGGLDDDETPVPA